MQLCVVRLNGSPVQTKAHLLMIFDHNEKYNILVKLTVCQENLSSASLSKVARSALAPIQLVVLSDVLKQQTKKIHINVV